jgi:NADPH:quinone reductase-like Zn-dependent oxidoreductase
MSETYRYVAVDPENRAMGVTDGDMPTPGPGELLIRVGAAGLNRAEL